MGDDVKLNYGNNCTALYLQNQTLKTDINDTSNHLMYINNTSIRVKKTNCRLLPSLYCSLGSYLCQGPRLPASSGSLRCFHTGISLTKHTYVYSHLGVCFWPILSSKYKLKLQVKKKLYHVNTNQKKASSSILLSKQVLK